MIDWDKPIVRADTGVEVYFCKWDNRPDFGDYILVQDGQGNTLPFLPCGTPMGHFASIINKESHKHVVRHHLVSLIRARANQLIDTEMVTLEETEAWGMF